MRRFLSVLVVLAAGCADQPTQPHADGRHPALAVQAEDHGPPAPYSFGRDTWRVGLFTGEGITPAGLSCDKSGDMRTCTGFLASDVDGARLDVTLQIPENAPKPVPLIVVVHGYGGSKSSSGDMVGPLLAEGYAVLRYSTRGFGKSWGQVNMVDVHAEVADLRSMIAQVVDRPNYHLNPDAVAVTGASYGGGHSWLAALRPSFTTPKGNVVRIRTVMPIAAWSDLLYSLLPNGRDRESVDGAGGLKLSYVNGLYASGIREDAERPYPNYPEYFIGWHAWLNAQEPNRVDPLWRSIEHGLAGYRSIWWQTGFWDVARTSPIPIFMAQGFTDDLFPMVEAKRMLLALQAIDPAYPIAAYFGDIGHPRASNKTGEIDYVLSLFRPWLAWYLKGEGAPPATVIYAALTRPRDEPFNAANVVVVPTLSMLATGAVSKRFDAPALLINPGGKPAGGFFWDPLVMEGARELQPLPEPPDAPLVPGSATYEVPVNELTGGGALVVAGEPTVALHASSLAWRVQLNVRLFDVDPAGGKRLITRGTYTIENPTIGLPIGETDIVIPTYGNLYRVEPGHTLRIELTNVDSPYLTPSRIPSETTVTGVVLTIPFRAGM